MSTGTVVLFALMLATALSPAIGGQQLRAIELGHTDTDGTSGLHVPFIGLLVAGDAVTETCTCTGTHMSSGWAPLTCGLPAAGWSAVDAVSGRVVRTYRS